jgi:hypothetical protein
MRFNLAALLSLSVLKRHIRMSDNQIVRSLVRLFRDLGFPRLFNLKNVDYSSGFKRKEEGMLIGNWGIFNVLLPNFTLDCLAMLLIIRKSLVQISAWRLALLIESFHNFPKCIQ